MLVWEAVSDKELGTRDELLQEPTKKRNRNITYFFIDWTPQSATRT